MNINLSPIKGEIGAQKLVFTTPQDQNKVPQKKKIINTPMLDIKKNLFFGTQIQSSTQNLTPQKGSKLVTNKDNPQQSYQREQIKKLMEQNQRQQNLVQNVSKSSNQEDYTFSPQQINKKMKSIDKKQEKSKDSISQNKNIIEQDILASQYKLENLNQELDKESQINFKLIKEKQFLQAQYALLNKQKPYKEVEVLQEKISDLQKLLQSKMLIINQLKEKNNSLSNIQDNQPKNSDRGSLINIIFNKQKQSKFYSQMLILISILNKLLL